MLATRTATYRAGVYARISRDDDKDFKAVGRQEKDGRYALNQMGIDLHRVYVDDDVSGGGHVVRDDYENLIRDLGEGTINAVWASEVSRYQRNLHEFVKFVDLAEERKLLVLWGEFGRADFRTGDGIDVLENQATSARNELRTLKRRVNRKMQELREEGAWAGRTRTYGYVYDPQTKIVAVVENEAEVIREVVKRYLQGEAISHIATDLNGRGIPRTYGGMWVPTEVHTLLRRPAIAGLRDKDHPGSWEPIITIDQWQEVQRLLDGRRGGYVAASPRKHLLTGGVAVCGGCGCHLQAQGSGAKRRMDCRAKAPQKSCGRVSIRMEHTERAVGILVARAVDGGALERLMAAGDRDELARLGRELADVRQRQADLGESFGAGKISQRVMEAADDRLDAEIKRVEMEIGDLRAKLFSIPELPSPLEPIWDKQPAHIKRSIIRLLVKQVIVSPVGKGTGPKFDPSRLEVVWRSLS